MRADQSERLMKLAESLTDMVLFEAVPERWSGHGKEPAELTRDERGDRYWCKKNAAATLALLGRVEHLLVNYRDRGPSAAPPEAEHEDNEPGLDAEIQRAESEAAKQLARVLKAQRVDGKV